MPAELRSRVKQLAAKRQSSVQDRAAGDRELSGPAYRPPPDLGKTIAILRQHAPELKKRGVEHLYVFGSLVRGEAGPDSDIDLAIDVAPGADFSLLDLVRIKLEAEDLLDRPIDLVERKMLKRFVRPEVEREATRIF